VVILQRFLRERQILARLQHPHIAQLLDGGATSDGRPFRDGIRVRRSDYHVLRSTLADVSSRLDLFTAVCDAVQYPQNLVVHRDLKPSNAMVTSSGAVKLLDFRNRWGPPCGGPERLVGRGHAHAARQRADDARIRCPEQVRGEPITTATDVRAGTLLYELLTGRGLIASRVLRPPKSNEITGRDVERPSSAVSRRISSGEVARKPSRGHAERVPTGCGGSSGSDLDTIVLRALQKDPARRCVSAGAFADDIRRYRSGRPIAARRDWSAIGLENSFAGMRSA
jgi:serine/threonine-protein kinase